MESHRRFIPYRRDLKRRSQGLRRDPTPAERKLWFEFLRDLPEKFTRQKPLGHYIADFYCSSYRLVIEIDGDSHFDDRGQAYDARRTAALEAEGIRVLRVTNLEVREEFEGVCQRIRDALTRVP
jgi:very-short-patch-repair endonuclease